MNVKDLKWFVYCNDFNDKKIKEFNVFNHSRFCEDVKKDLKKCETKEEFAEKLRRNLFYYYGSKCEWEVVVTSWVPHITADELNRLNAEREKTLKEYKREPYCLYVKPDVAKKIDVKGQIMLNFDLFLDYVWLHKPAKRNRRNKSVGKCSMAKNYCKFSSNGYCIAEDDVINKCPYLSAIGEIAKVTVSDNE